MKINVGLCQYAIAWEDKTASKAVIDSLIQSTFNGKAQDPNWLIFPEMSLTGFSMNSAITALTLSDIKYFAKMARTYQSFISFGGVLNQKNCLITLSPTGNMIHCYEKIHLFSYAKEEKFYLPGDRTQGVFSIQDVTVFPGICYDVRFADMFWGSSDKYEIIVIIANFPGSRSLHWRTLLQARAIENQAFVIGVNRVGVDPKIAYTGDSMVISPDGTILQDAGDRVGIFTAQLNLDYVKKVRSTFSFFSDRK